MNAEAAVHAARQGDLEAFNRLVLEHQAAVYNLAWWVLGDEAAAVAVTEAAFAGARRAVGAHRAGPFRLLVLRCWVGACRARLGRAVGAGDFPCLRALPPAQCLALALVDLARLDYAEAGAVLGITVAQVRRDLAAGRVAIGSTLVRT